MATHLRIQNQHSSFDDERTVHPWNCMLNQLYNEIDQDDIKQLIFLAKPHLGGKYQKMHERADFINFIDTLEAKFGEDTPDVLSNLLRATKLHDPTAEFCYDKLIEAYKTEKRKHDVAQNQLKNVNFVGREDLLERLRHCFENDAKIKGVMLSGMSGIGKTAVANELCYRLKSQTPMSNRWKIVRITQLEKTDIKDLYKDVIYSLFTAFEQEYSVQTADNVQELQQQLKAVMTDVMTADTPRKLLYIDNVDGYCRDKQTIREFESFLKTLIAIIQVAEKHAKVRFLITGQKLFVSIQPIFVCFHDHMVQYEVQSLSDTDAITLLRKTSKLSAKELTDERCRDINSAVHGNSMALQHVAMNLSTDVFEHRSVESFISRVLVGQEMLTKLHKCLEHSILGLDSPADQQTTVVRQVLVNMSLFKTAWFSFHDALEVAVKLEEGSWASKYNKNYFKETTLILSIITLKGHHLIEIDGFSADGPKTEQLKSSSYALHPLVYQYILSRYTDSDGTRVDRKVVTERREARLRFLKQFCNLIEKCGKMFNVDPPKAQAQVERNKVHFRHFYEYFLQETVTLSEVLGPKDKRLDGRFNHLWKIGETIQSAVVMVSFAKKLSSDAEKEKNLYQYVYWKCKEVGYQLSIGRTDLAVFTLTDLSNKLQLVNISEVTEVEKALTMTQLDWKLDQEQRKPMLACFYETKGRALKAEKTDNPHVLYWLTNAQKLYSQMKKSSCQEDRARVINLIGCHYFDISLLEKSKCAHRLALETLEAVGGRKNTHRHPDSTTYLTNLAACDHQLAEKTSDTVTKDTLLRSALEMYNSCVEYDRNMKRDFLKTHAMTLMNRAEIYYKLLMPQQALTDAAKSLDIFKQYFSIPHVQKTLAYAQNAYFYYKIGKKHSEADQRKVMLQKSVHLYDDSLTEITHGGLPMEHKQFTGIKDFHIKAMKALQMIEKDIDNRLRRYAELEEKGAVGIILPSIEDFEGQTPSSPTSSHSSEKSSDSDDNILGGDRSVVDDISRKLDAMIEQNICRKRRDSGVESDEEDTEMQSVMDIHMNVPEDNKITSLLKTDAIVSKEVEETVKDDTESMSTSLDSNPKIAMLKRGLQRQDSFELEEPLEYDPVPGTSSSGIDKQISNKSDCWVEMRPRKRRKSSVDMNRLSSLTSHSSFGSVDPGYAEGNRLSTSTNRSSLSSIGSQDSVTSQLGKKLILQSELSLQEEEADILPNKEDSKQPE